MEMHQVRYFLAVAETLNFTRAAEQCHVAQPSLSRAVHKLEAELGGDLFRRVRGVALGPWAAELGAKSWAQVFLRYVLANPAVTCVIPGTGKPAHARDNLAAGLGPLPEPGIAPRIAAIWDRM